MSITIKRSSLQHATISGLSTAWCRCVHSLSLTLVPSKLTLRPQLRYLQIGHSLVPMLRCVWVLANSSPFWAVQCGVRLIRLLFCNCACFLMLTASAFAMRRRAAMRQALGTPISVFSLTVVGPCWGLSLGGSGHTLWYRHVPRHRMQATAGGKKQKQKQQSATAQTSPSSAKTIKSA